MLLTDILTMCIDVNGHGFQNGVPSGQRMHHLVTNAEAMSYAAYVGGQNMISTELPVMASQLYARSPAELAQKQHRSSFDHSDMYGEDSPRNAFIKNEYGEHSPGHYLTSPNEAQMHHFNDFSTEYVVSSAQHQTPLTTPTSMEYRNLQTYAYGAAADDFMEDENMDSAANAPPNDSPSRKKRGRPKLELAKTAVSRDSAGSERTRMPHNEVERKYRESLNVGFEKLRSSVPTLPENSPTAGGNVQKQSKAAVLGAAIDYIKYLESETERLKDENSNLKGDSPNVGTKEKRGANAKHGKIML